jgi:hypothetical protein
MATDDGVWEGVRGLSNAGRSPGRTRRGRGLGTLPGSENLRPARSSRSQVLEGARDLPPSRRSALVRQATRSSEITRSPPPCVGLRHNPGSSAAFGSLKVLSPNAAPLEQWLQAVDQVDAELGEQVPVTRVTDDERLTEFGEATRQHAGRHVFAAFAQLPERQWPTCLGEFPDHTQCPSTTGKIEQRHEWAASCRAADNTSWERGRSTVCHAGLRSFHGGVRLISSFIAAIARRRPL